MFEIDGRPPKTKHLGKNLFNLPNLTIRLDRLQSVLMSLNEQQISNFLKVYKKFQPLVDKASSKNWNSISNQYFDDLNRFLLRTEKLSVEDTSRVSMEVLSSFAKDKNKIMSFSRVGGFAGQYYFILPDVVEAVNGNPDPLINLSTMLISDELFNRFIARNSPLNGKLKMLSFSPVFKTLTFTSILELHKELAEEPSCTDQYVYLKKQLIIQYITPPLIVAEQFFPPLAYFWLPVFFEQMYTEIQHVKRQMRLSVSNYEAFLITLGFRKDQLVQTDVLRQLVAMNLNLLKIYRPIFQKDIMISS